MTQAEAPHLHRLLFRSRCAISGSEAAIHKVIDAIVELSHNNNERDDITSVLLFTATAFIQALEGPRLALETTFERICCDIRHTDVEIIQFAPATEREFGNRRMHYIHVQTATEALFMKLGEHGAARVLAAQAAADATSTRIQS